MDDTYSHYSPIVENYRRYRPRYPQQLVEWLKTECGLLPTHRVTDIGAGTGQLTELFLQNGNPVYAVEPNAEMRAAAAEHLRGYPGFTSLGATAEVTTLGSQSVDFIVVGNAFHWFNHAQVRPEFLRVLRPGGWVVLVWNLERNNGSPFAKAFEQFWQKHIDPAARFARLSERKRSDYITQFFGPANLKEKSLDNYQVCNFEALKGLTQSFLKAPQTDDPRYPAMLGELKAIFDQYQKAGTVTLEYDTAISYGQLLA
ncbi:MAG: methyltransferase domain-containing protein [Chloroflexi bacterium]|nr:methyltransferase domain-containing protein [Chloroflexota bacterium]